MREITQYDIDELFEELKYMSSAQLKPIQGIVENLHDLLETLHTTVTSAVWEANQREGKNVDKTD